MTVRQAFSFRKYKALGKRAVVERREKRTDNKPSNTLEEFHDEVVFVKYGRWESSADSEVCASDAMRPTRLFHYSGKRETNDVDVLIV